MGEVYRALDTRLDRLVAIKFVCPERWADSLAAERLANEARIASALNHPGIVAVYDVGSFSGRPFIVMEYVEGQSLATLLLGGPLKVRDGLRIGWQIADALAAAHAAGVVHRDLKPQNVMLSPDGRPKIVDFGLGTLNRDDDTTQKISPSSPTITSGLRVQGTVGYMSPEQAAGNYSDMRADQFALGAMLYEMVSGHRAFLRETDVQTLADIIEGEPRPLASVCRSATPALIAIVNRCLQKNPRDRYGSTVDLAHDLKVAAAAAISDTRIPRRPVPIIARARRWRVAAVLAAATLAVVLMGLQWGDLRTMGGPVSAQPANRHVAILPLVTIAGGPDDQILADGLMETLTSSLTTLEQFERGLRVVPASEMRRERIESARQARQSFGATLAISGSLQRDGDALRLTFNLIDSVQLVQLASRTIDLPAGETHRGLQQLVTATVAGLLDLQLRPEESAAMTAGGSAEPGAYQQFARGRGYLQRFDRGADHVDLAIDAFAQAIKLDPQFALAYAAAAESYWRKYDMSRLPIWLDRAEEHAERALEINPRLPAIHVVLAMIARGRGRYEEATVMAQRAVSLDPVAADGYRELGRAYEAIDRSADAEVIYRRAIAARPDDWLAYNTLGSFLLARRRWPEAEAAFKQAIALTPDNTRAHNNLGATYYGMGRPDEAAAAWEHSSSIRPTSAAASNLGTYYYRRGRYTEAARNYERAVALTPGSHRLWRNLGAALYWAPGERDKAAAAYRQAIELAEQERQVNPRQPALLAELADAYSMVGGSQEARAAAAAVERLGSSDAETIFNVASAYEQIGDRAQAIRWLQKALAAGYSRELLAQSPGLAALRDAAGLTRPDTRPVPYAH
jgi:tetratricopeptide (TPR) repeat protein